MKVLVINSGSSSIKFQLLDMSDETVMAAGLVERIGEDEGRLVCTLRPGTAAEKDVELHRRIIGHQEGMHLAVQVLSEKDGGVISDRREIDRIGHRFVHGGQFHAPIVIDDAVIAELEETIPLVV